MSSAAWYIPSSSAPLTGRDALIRGLQQLDADVAVVQTSQGPGVATGGVAVMGGDPPKGALKLLAWVPKTTPDQLGAPSFRETYGVRANYVAGAMANGIASAELVIVLAKAGLMGFFGAAGLDTPTITTALDRIQDEAGDLAYGVNLIHSPATPYQEQETVDLLLARGVHNVEASAFMRLTAPIVQYRISGLHRDAAGNVVAPNRVIAKVSRPEVAIQFLEPAPKKLVDKLLSEGRITPEEAELSQHIPMASDITAEADSGGHTDNRPAPVLIPLLCQLRDQVVTRNAYAQPVRIGAAGGLSTPASIAGAFALGADYVMTGTVNQACVESGTSDMAKVMLATAGMADVGMAPASDMFEAGVEVQVLKRGTMFASRGHKLYTLYRQYPSWDAIPAAEQQRVEKTLLRQSFEDVYAGCVAFFGERDPEQITRAEADPKHKMALVFRWYLGLSSRWAIGGVDDRRQDIQVWCGPAIGAFNAWTEDTFLAEPHNRSAVTVAANLMAGAALVTRVRSLRQQGVEPGLGADAWVPRPLS